MQSSIRLCGRYHLFHQHTMQNCLSDHHTDQIQLHRKESSEREEVLHGKKDRQKKQPNIMTHHCIAHIKRCRPDSSKTHQSEGPIVPNGCIYICYHYIMLFQIIIAYNFSVFIIMDRQVYLFYFISALLWTIVRKVIRIIKPHRWRKGQRVHLECGRSWIRAPVGSNQRL